MRLCVVAELSHWAPSRAIIHSLQPLLICRPCLFPSNCIVLLCIPSHVVLVPHKQHTMCDELALRVTTAIVSKSKQRPAQHIILNKTLEFNGSGTELPNPRHCLKRFPLPVKSSVAQRQGIHQSHSKSEVMSHSQLDFRLDSMSSRFREERDSVP